MILVQNLRGLGSVGLCVVQDELAECWLQISTHQGINVSDVQLCLKPRTHDET